MNRVSKLSENPSYKIWKKKKIYVKLGSSYHLDKTQDVSGPITTIVKSFCVPNLKRKNDNNNKNYAKPDSIYHPKKVLKITVTLTIDLKVTRDRCHSMVNVCFKFEKRKPTSNPWLVIIRTWFKRNLPLTPHYGRSLTLTFWPIALKFKKDFFIPV